MQELIRAWRREFVRAPIPTSSAPPTTRRSYLRQFDGISELGIGVAEGAAAGGRGKGVDGVAEGAAERGGAGGEEIPFLIVQLSADINLQGLMGRQRRAQLAALALPRVAVVPGEVVRVKCVCVCRCLGVGGRDEGESEKLVRAQAEARVRECALVIECCRACVRVNESRRSSEKWLLCA